MSRTASENLLTGAAFIVGMRAEARIARRLGPIGIGAASAERLAAEASALISFGIAGGLDPARLPGALVVPEAVVTPDGERFATDPALTAALGGANAVAMLASPGIVGERAAKARLFAAFGAAAVDMESGAVARAAERHGIPFAVMRAIGDPAARDLPPAAIAAFDAKGIAAGRLIASLVAAPGQIPALIALARETQAALRALRRRVDSIERRSHGLAVNLTSQPSEQSPP